MHRLNADYHIHIIVMIRIYLCLAHNNAAAAKGLSDIHNEGIDIMRRISSILSACR